MHCALTLVVQEILLSVIDMRYIQLMQMFLGPYLNTLRCLVQLRVSVSLSLKRCSLRLIV